MILPPLKGNPLTHLEICRAAHPQQETVWRRKNRASIQFEKVNIHDT